MARWAPADMPDQTGRTVLVTGANSGLGLASAKALAGRGAALLMGCRSPERAEVARAEVAAVATGPDPLVVALDLADLGSVRAAATEVAARVERLDVLINNAGIMATPRGRTAEGVELQFGTNHLGHFALTGLLLPSLLSAGAPRVVTTSSLMHRVGDTRWKEVTDPDARYNRWTAYGRSKLANLVFARELARRAAEAGRALVSVAAHPGYASTHLAAASREGRWWPLGRAVAVVTAAGDIVAAQPAEAGALPQLYAATMPDVTSGDYFGPDGPFELRGGPRRVGTTASASDDAAALRLWALSEELSGVTFPW
jgi:NAD(P)-dependent dehydrogenase (short-subunit alcohol dehydrogenase family)